MSSTPEWDAQQQGAASAEPQARPGDQAGTAQGTMPGQQQPAGSTPPAGVPGQPGYAGDYGTQPGYGAQPGHEAQQGYPAGQDWGAVPGRPMPVNQAETRVTGRRVIQYVIDYILVGIIPGLAYWLFDRGHGFLHGFGWTLATLIAIVVYLWYWVIRPHGHDGQTFAMQWFGLRVISKYGGPASMAQLFIRGVLLVIDTLFFGLVGLITMLCSRYRQRVGDHAARTLVVDARIGTPRSVR